MAATPARCGVPTSWPTSRALGGALAYYESEDAFVDMVGRVTELGFSEIDLYFPARDEQRATFEKIALDVIPELKAY